MPKKQTSKKKPVKSTLPFAHPTKHGRLHWKKVLFIILLGAFGLVVAAAIVAQMFYNKYLWEVANMNANLKITIMIQNSLESLDNLKSSPTVEPDGRLTIKETGLILPKETNEIKKLLYYYYPNTSGTYENGDKWYEPQSIQITTSSISSNSRTSLLNSRTVDELFKIVPRAQACNRGFLIQFEPFREDYQNVKTKPLNDGRRIYLHREPECKGNYLDDYLTYEMDNFESYLLQAQSY